MTGVSEKDEDKNHSFFMGLEKRKKERERDIQKAKLTSIRDFSGAIDVMHKSDTRWQEEDEKNLVGGLDLILFF